jgi:hypothetical protein
MCGILKVFSKNLKHFKAILLEDISEKLRLLKFIFCGIEALLKSCDAF